MTRIPHRLASVVVLLVAFFGLQAAATSPVSAQDEASVPMAADTVKAQESYKNTIAGELTPGKGFDVIRTERGSLNLSVYGLFRWIDQTPGEQTFTDHLGRTRVVKARNDLNWHRSMIWVSGFFYDPRFSYRLTVWSLPTTQQALVFGLASYRFNKAFTASAGIAPNLTSRSMQGSWPYWGGSDRQMSEEFFRAGFSSGVFVAGEVLPRLAYNASVNTNLSQLGVTATNDERDMAYSGNLTWLPSTGEFGPRQGFGDFEYHKQLATRVGISGCTATEGRGAPVGQTNNETQLRLSDGVYAFEEGALADTVTVKKLDYNYLGFDVGAKYRGFCILGEFYYRSLSNFQTTSPVAVNMIKDTGFQVQAMQMIVPKTLGVYATAGYVMDDFKRYPWEISGGASFYPSHTRAWRLNLHINHMEKSPTGSTFGYYTAGQTGTTFSLGTDILL